MKKLLYFLFFIGFPIAITAQNWTLVNSNTTDGIRDVYFKDASTGFFLTDMGKIYKTTDAGDNWTFIHQDTAFIDNFDPNYPTKELSIVATNDSLFAYSTTNQSVRIKSSLSSFSFTKDTLNHWVKDPVFWNNEIWDIQRVNQLLGGSAPSNLVTEEFVVSDNYIWATNALKIYSSDDFGATWQQHQFTTIPLTSGPYQSYYNGGDSLVAITHYPMIFHVTNDNGFNWSSYESSLSGARAHFINQNNILAYYFNSSVLYTSTNTGISFQSEVFDEGILGIEFISDSIGFVYGKNGMLYKTTNGGGLLAVKEQVKPNLKVYPNPAKEKINLDYDASVDIISIQLLDVSGKVVRTYTTNFQEIDVSGVQNGTYLLCITTAVNNFTHKVIVH